VAHVIFAGEELPALLCRKIVIKKVGFARQTVERLSPKPKRVDDLIVCDVLDSL